MQASIRKNYQNILFYIHFGIAMFQATPAFIMQQPGVKLNALRFWWMEERTCSWELEIMNVRERLHWDTARLNVSTIWIGQVCRWMQKQCETHVENWNGIGMVVEYWHIGNSSFLHFWACATVHNYLWEISEFTSSWQIHFDLWVSSQSCNHVVYRGKARFGFSHFHDTRNNCRSRESSGPTYQRW